jgi:hypothetical protein
VSGSDGAVKKSKQRKKGVDLTKPVERPRMPLTIMLRIFLVGSIAVVASGYAIYRHYYVTRPSMLVPLPPEPPPELLPPDLLPVPDLVPFPSSSAPVAPSASAAPSSSPSR